MAIYNYGLPMPNYQTPIPYQQQYPQVQQTISNTPITANQNTANSIIWVQGEAGAKAYPVAPGNSVLLMDSESECFYIKSTDSSGIPMPLRVFSYNEIVQTQPTQHQQSQAGDTEQYVTKSEFDELKKVIEEMQSRTMRRESKHEQTLPRNSAKQSNE